MGFGIKTRIIRGSRMTVRSLRMFRYLAAASGLSLHENERKLLALKGAAQGCRIFVLGNGPSLARTDVDRLCDEVTIASNGIFLMFETKRFRPTYYTVEDCLVAEDRAKEISALSGFVKLFPEDLRVFIPGDDETLFVNFVRDYFRFPRFHGNFAHKAYWGGTVSFMNLQLAYYLGASEIYLLGFDHNYAAPTRHDKNNGGVITSGANDSNHFDPRYFGKGYRWHDPLVERMESAYRVAKRFLEQRGVKVFNATDGGHLEVFTRVSYDSLFDRSPIKQSVV